jgi:hypothetical protein
VPKQEYDWDAVYNEHAIQISELKEKLGLKCSDLELEVMIVQGKVDPKPYLKDIYLGRGVHPNADESEIRKDHGSKTVVFL